MPARIDITGKRFGRLIVIGQAPRKGYRYWECKCDCGGRAAARSDNLRAGHIKSCGCLLRRDKPDFIWSDEEKRRLAELWPSYSAREISALMKRTPKAVWAMKDRLGLPRPEKLKRVPPGRKTRRHPTEEEYATALRECAREAGIPEYRAFLATKSRTIVQVRWRAWARLRAQGFTQGGIATISGYDHTSITHAEQRMRQQQAAE